MSSTVSSTTLFLRVTLDPLATMGVGDTLLTEASRCCHG